MRYRIFTNLLIIMSIFGSDNQPSGTVGGLFSGLLNSFGLGGSAANTPTSTDNPGKKSGGFSGKLATGALLAAGAAYLYKRNKKKNSSFTSN